MRGAVVVEDGMHAEVCISLKLIATASDRRESSLVLS